MFLLRRRTPSSQPKHIFAFRERSGSNAPTTESCGWTPRERPLLLVLPVTAESSVDREDVGEGGVGAVDSLVPVGEEAAVVAFFSEGGFVGFEEVAVPGEEVTLKRG